MEPVRFRYLILQSTATENLILTLVKDGLSGGVEVHIATHNARSQII